jgi:hypothetical protein
VGGRAGTFIKRLSRRKRAAPGAALQYSVVRAELRIQFSAGPAKSQPGLAAGSGAAAGFPATGTQQAPLPPRAPIVLVRSLRPPPWHVSARAAPGRPSLVSIIGGFPSAAKPSPPPPGPAGGGGSPPPSQGPAPGSGGSRQQVLQQVLALLTSRCMAELASAAGLRGVQDALSAAGQQLGPCTVQQALPPSPPAHASVDQPPALAQQPAGPP